MTLPRWFIPVAFAAALAGAAWRAPQPAAPAFLPLPPALGPTEAAMFHAELLPQTAPAAHAATLARLPNEQLAAAWFAGSREGAADVAIWFSTLSSKGWSPPDPIATRESTAGDTLAYVRKLGNPLLYSDGQHLHLWYVSAAMGGWAASSINHSRSGDNGQSWSAAEKLTTSPFFNISTLVRSPPLPLADGGLALPVYHEFIAKHGEWLRLGANGKVVDKVRMSQPVPALQPASIPLGGQQSLALLRDAGPGPGQVRVSRSDDGGQHWQAEPALPIANPNSSLALVRLASGRLLLAANPGEGRSTLNLWLSEDQGRSWRASRTIESAPDGGAEFSYPALLVTPEGRIHLAYTWRRQGIKHATFNEAWLDGEKP